LLVHDEKQRLALYITPQVLREKIVGAAAIVSPSGPPREE